MHESRDFSSIFFQTKNVYRVFQLKVYDRVSSLNQLIDLIFCYILFLYLFKDNFNKHF